MPDQTRSRELVEALFFMTPTQLELMETRREVILSAASELEAFETPSLSDDGLRILRELTVRLTGLHDVCAFFDARTVRSLREEYESLPEPELGSVEGMLEFQLGLLAYRICSDYATGNSFYAEPLLSKLAGILPGEGVISWDIGRVGAWAEIRPPQPAV